MGGGHDAAEQLAGRSSLAAASVIANGNSNWLSYHFAILAQLRWF